MNAPIMISIIPRFNWLQLDLRKGYDYEIIGNQLCFKNDETQKEASRRFEIVSYEYIGLKSSQDSLNAVRFYIFQVLDSLGIQGVEPKVDYRVVTPEYADYLFTDEGVFKHVITPAVLDYSGLEVRFSQRA